MGGWTDSTGDKYSRVVSSGSARRALVSSVVAFLRRHNFQGLHLDWNYPVCWHSDCTKGPESDKNNFVKLVQVRHLQVLLWLKFDLNFLIKSLDIYKDNNISPLEIYVGMC